MGGRGQGLKRRQGQQVQGGPRTKSMKVNQSSAVEDEGARGQDMMVVRRRGGGQRKNPKSGSVKKPGNPLMNQVVLSRLFKVCELTDLRRFRLVSKQWYDLSLTRWRDEMTLEMRPKVKDSSNSDADTNSDNEGSFDPNTDLKRVGMFWEEEVELYNNSPEFRKLQLKPFKNYCLSDVELAPQNMDTLLNNCGSSMRQLQIFDSHFSDSEYFRQMIFAKTPNLELLHVDNLKWVEKDKHQLERKTGDGLTVDKAKPNRNLKTLIVDRVWRTLDEMMQMPIPWGSYFKQFPNVENLGTRFFGKVEMTALVETLEQLAESGEQQITIKTLDIRFLSGAQPEIVKRLVQQTQMKLEAIQLDMSTAEDDSHGVLPLVVSLHGKSLKELVLKNESGYLEKMPYYNFPSIAENLTSLTNLYLIGNVVSNLHFLAHTPNLKILHISQIVEGETASLFEKTNPSHLKNMCLPHVVELHFAFKLSRLPDVPSTYVLSGAQMRMISALMPGVQRFTSPLSTEAIRIVCENWKDLRKLKMSTRWMADSQITGIMDGRVGRIPSVIDLKYLCELSICQTWQGYSGLTDDAVYNGFLKMPFLHTLGVTLSKYTSNKAFLALFNKFPGMDLRRDNPCRMKKADKILSSELKSRGIVWQRNFC